MSLRSVHSASLRRPSKGDALLTTLLTGFFGPVYRIFLKLVGAQPDPSKGKTDSPSPLSLLLGLSLGLLFLPGCGSESPDPASVSGTNRLPFSPRTYAIQRAPTPPTIDGRLTETAWAEADWTAPFVNSQGRNQPSPPFQTRAKMMWDDTYLYVAAQLEESDVRATFTTRDTSIWRENAFELFIDPDGDTHNYYEYQINARETQWDLLLTKPYRDAETPRISAWDIRGLKKGVTVQGTLNEPSDTDEGWTVELALPWSVLAETAPNAQPPQDGDQWRLNLTRMQWPVTVTDGNYVQDTTDSGAFAWSPQGGTGNYHKPERWGIVEFSTAPTNAPADTVRVPPNERVKWALRRLYYRQNAYREANGTYASSLRALNAADISLENRTFNPRLQTTQSSYEITASGANGASVHIRHDGKVWTTTE